VAAGSVAFLDADGDQDVLITGGNASDEPIQYLFLADFITILQGSLSFPADVLGMEGLA
jgi:hypothetical protein